MTGAEWGGRVRGGEGREVTGILGAREGLFNPKKMGAMEGVSRKDLVALVLSKTLFFCSMETRP